MDPGLREALGHEIAHITSAAAKVKEAMDKLDGLAFTEPPVEVDDRQDVMPFDPDLELGEPTVEWRLGHMERVVEALEQDCVTGERMETAKSSLAKLRSLAANPDGEQKANNIQPSAPGSSAKANGTGGRGRARR